MRTTAVAAFGAALFLAPVAAQAQDPAAPSAPAPAEPIAAAPTAAVTPAPQARLAQLNANTPITLSVNHEVNSRHVRVGDTFPLTLVQDVSVDGHVVIPRGTRAVGELVWRTGKGVFGKSAKMEVALRYLEMDGRRIPLDGSYRQEGEGNTGATVGAVLGAGVIGGLLVTGRSAVIPAGRELQARIIDAIPVSIPTPTSDGRTAVAMIADTYNPTAVQTGRPGGAPTRNARRR